MVQPEPAGLGQHFEGQVDRAIGAGRTISDFPRAAPRIGGEFLEIPPGRIRLHHNDQRISRQQRYGCQACAFEGSRSLEKRIRSRDRRKRHMRDHAGIAIGPCRGACIHAKRAARAASVLQDHGLVPMALQGGAIGPRDQIRRPAGREGHDDGDRPVRETCLR